MTFIVDKNRILNLLSDIPYPTMKQIQNLSFNQDDLLSWEQIAFLINGMYSAEFPSVKEWVLAKAAKFRQQYYGNNVVSLSPVEVSNHCSSNCYFCGWRSSNYKMNRVHLDRYLVLRQVDYLVEKGIRYIELVGGDSVRYVRDELPPLLRQIKQKYPDIQLIICTMALTEQQYANLKQAGADGMIVWQETYDKDIYHKYIKSGFKAFGVTDDFRLDRTKEGCSFRMSCQDRALRAGLNVSVGSMLGMNPDVRFEIFATIMHAEYLIKNYEIHHPIIIGMPTWNPLTTKETDNYPSDSFKTEDYFSYIAAVYFLALDKKKTWVFPTCRVTWPVHLESVLTSGALTSTEVRISPGGYFREILKSTESEESNNIIQLLKTNLKKPEMSDSELLRYMDKMGQFKHFYKTHEDYIARFSEAGIEVNT